MILMTQGISVIVGQMRVQHIYNTSLTVTGLLFEFSGSCNFSAVESRSKKFQKLVNYLKNNNASPNYYTILKILPLNFP